jgi:hypothetical protein
MNCWTKMSEAQDPAYPEAMQEIAKLAVQIALLKRQLELKDEHIAQLENFIRRHTGISLWSQTRTNHLESEE